jgi:hypothetical protein
MSEDYDLVVSEGKIVAFRFPDMQPIYFTEPHTLEQAQDAGKKVLDFRKTYQMSSKPLDPKRTKPKIAEFVKTITVRQREDFIRPLAEAGKKGVAKMSMKDQGPALAGVQATMTSQLESLGLERIWEKYYASDGETYYKVKDEYLDTVREALKLV